MDDMNNFADFVTTREPNLDRMIEDLIGKMLSGKATKKEIVRYQELAAERAVLMRPRRPLPFRNRANKSGQLRKWA
jgi:hypothetical protein